MLKSWEFTDEEKKRINEESRKVAEQYDPVTGKKKNSVESTGDNEDVESIGSWEKIKDDDDRVR